MNDTHNNGWGYTFGVRQNGVVISNFSLLSGSYGTKTVTVLGGNTVDIVVVAVSASNSRVSNQIIFTIT